MNVYDIVYMLVIGYFFYKHIYFTRLHSVARKKYKRFQRTAKKYVRQTDGY